MFFSHKNLICTDLYPRHWPGDCTSCVHSDLRSNTASLDNFYVGLASDGLDVAVNDISHKLDDLKKLVGEIEATGRKAIAIPGDVSKEADVQAMVKQTVDSLGGLDVV